jgi:hypothetical protein
MKLLRFPMLMILLLLLSHNAALALPEGIVLQGAQPSTEVQLFQWAVTQGGLVLVVLFVFWSYRRDFQRLFDTEHQKAGELLLALQSNTSALASHAEMLREQAQAAREQARSMSDLAGTVKGCQFAQEVFESRGGTR